jgi:chaperonin GroES
MKQPLGDRVIVKPDAAINVSESGLEMPDESVPRPQSGTAIKVGINCREVKDGMKVYYGKFAGQTFEIEGVEHLLMREAEILGVD